MELYHHCSGNWNALVQELGVSREHLHRLLTYFATFLSNVGNYFVSYNFPVLVSLYLLVPGLWRPKVCPGTRTRSAQKIRNQVSKACGAV